MGCLVVSPGAKGVPLWPRGLAAGAGPWVPDGLLWAPSRDFMDNGGLCGVEGRMGCVISRHFR